MSFKIAVMSQTGDCGKSALALTLTLEALKTRSETKIIDLDKEHQSCVHWKDDRDFYGITPSLDVTLVESAKDAIKASEGAFATIYDCPSRATEITPVIAKHVDLVVIPTPPNLKSIREHLKLINVLLEKGVPAHKISVMFSRVKTEAEETSARLLLKSSDINGKTLEELNIKIFDSSIKEKMGYAIALDRADGLTDTSYSTLNNDAKECTLEIMYQVIANNNK